MNCARREKTGMGTRTKGWRVISGARSLETLERQKSQSVTALSLGLLRRYSVTWTGAWTASISTCASLIYYLGRCLSMSSYVAKFPFYSSAGLQQDRLLLLEYSQPAEPCQDGAGDFRENGWAQVISV